MLQSQTKPWLVSFLNIIFILIIHEQHLTVLQVYFIYFQTIGLYENNAIEDHLAFLFVFSPIMRLEISTYIDVWNFYCIYPQRHRFNHAAGIPNNLYIDQSLLWFGWHPDFEFVEQLNKTVENIGKSTNYIQKVNHWLISIRFRCIFVK